MQILSGAKRRVENLSWSPDGVRLAAGGQKGPLEVWDTATGERTHSIDFGALMPHNAIHFHPNGSLFLGGVGGLRRFDSGTGALQAWAEDQFPSHQIAVAPDGSFLLAVRDGTVVRFDCAPGRPRAWEVPHHPLGERFGSTCTGLVILPGGRRFASLEQCSLTPGLASQIPGLPAGKRDVSVVTLRDCETGRAIQYAPGPEVLSERSAASPDGSRIVLAGGPVLYVFRTDALTEPPVKVKNDAKLKFTGIAFHPSGQSLAAASNDKTVKLYDAKTWKPARTFEWKLEKMRSVCFSPDGLRLAAGAEKGQVVVWDADL